jgi:hypothetical protein
VRHQHRKPEAAQHFVDIERPAARLRRLGKDALLTIFPTSIEITFLIEFKPFPRV